MTAVDVDALDKLRDRLIMALRTHPDLPVLWPSSDRIADALLPVLDRIANQRAAAALREAASDVDDGEFSDRWSAAARASILARADALDPR